MSLFDDAQVRVLLADYIGVDLGGKINAIGAGFSLAHLQPNGLTGPQHIIAIVDLPGRYGGQQFSLELELRDETSDEAFSVAAGPDGRTHPLRFANVVTAPVPAVPGVHLPLDQVTTQVHLPLAIIDGLPLTAGHAYAWRVKLDGQTKQGWHSRFYVPGPPPPIVFGGPSGPATIPNVGGPPPSPAEPTPGLLDSDDD